MIILPAIDIMDARPVRLYQGDYGKSEIVADSVEDTAARFEKEGAAWIHMVDLDAAREGKRINHEHIARTAAALSIPVEVGGGIRTMEDVNWYLEHGIARVILGTAALQDPAFVKEAVSKWKERIAVGIDARDGMVAVSGWMDTSNVHYLDFARAMADLGVKTIIFTDISRDGTLSGPNLEMLKALQQQTDIQIIASGGIKNLEHIQQLYDLHLYGAITGKAMYTGSLSLPAAIAAGREAAC